MYFVFYAYVFDEVMIFEYLKSQNLIISKRKIDFELE